MSCITQDIESTKELLAEKYFFLSTDNTAPTDSDESKPKDNYKVTLWLSYWKKYNQVDYEPTSKDCAMLYQNIKVDKEEYEQMLKAYFTGDAYYCKTPSVGGFVAHRNQIRAYIRSAEEKRESSSHGFPSYYDATLYNKLEAAQLVLYRRHLLKLGYKAKKDKMGRVITWEYQQTSPSHDRDLQAMTKELMINKTIR